MRIGIDCRTILSPDRAEASGLGHYTHHLVQALLELDRDNEYVLFFDRPGAGAARRNLLAGHPRADSRIIPFQSVKRNLPFVYGHLFISGIFAKEKLDLLHAPAGAMPLFYKGTAVVTVHDLAVYDHPEWFPGEVPGTQTFSSRIVVPRSMEAARRIIVPSESTRRDIIRLFGVKEDKVDVIYEGSAERPTPRDVAARLKRLGVAAGKYVLFMGTLEPRKNVPAVVGSFVKAAQRGLVPDDAVLAIAGARGWKERKIFEAVERAKEELGAGRVRLLGYVSEDDKAALMSGAKVFLFPSLYEGFGLPVVEVMSLGIPVIASSVSSMPEVCGDACTLVSPRDEDAIAEALGRVFSDPELSGRMSRAGRERAKMFTWEKTARATLDTYRKAVAKRKA